MNKEKIYKAGLIIIGNEILSGRTIDKNIPHIATKLNDAGVRLAQVRIIPDIESEIVETVKTFSRDYDYVFTTGGIGPTHDDITAACVAKAFDVPLERNAEAVAMLEDYYAKGELTDARLIMADVPRGASLVPNPISGAPGFKLENVHVMAGVPRIMQGMLDFILPTLAGGSPMLSKTVEGKTGESKIAHELTHIVDEFPDLDIGSYPSFKNGFVSVAIVVRGTDQEVIDRAVNRVVVMMNEVHAEPHIVG